MLASLVQFEFLPIFAAIALYVGYNLWRFKRQSRRLQGALRASWRLTKRLHRFAYLAVFLVALGLFGGRYVAPTWWPTKTLSRSATKS